MSPKISNHYLKRGPSSIRKAQIEFSNRTDSDDIEVINLAIGNISLPMHPVMQDRLLKLGSKESPFKDGIVNYTETTGIVECQNAFKHIIESQSHKINNLHCLVTDGGSQAMELMLLGVCGPNEDSKIIIFDPSYTNYISISERIGSKFTTYTRLINDNGSFDSINITKISKMISEENINGILIIPADNPTGKIIKQGEIFKIAELCVQNDIWLISDEAYRELYYGDSSSSIWKIKEEELPGIIGKRISIETASKVWNACGLRIGALATDSLDFYEKSTFEYTANLSANHIGQYIFSAISNLTSSELSEWYNNQRDYYSKTIHNLIDNLKSELPGIIISNNESAIYLVVDFKRIVPKDFTMSDFISYCSEKGKVTIDNISYTLFMAPMEGFYKNKNNGKTQARIAVVEPIVKIKLSAFILSSLLNKYLKS